jgi:uncharacterized protein (TIGR03435 family)
MVIARKFLWIPVITGLAIGQTFETASVKRAPPDDGLGNSRIDEDAAQVSYRNVTFWSLLMNAYPGIYDVYGPDWIHSERYDVVAKIPEGATGQGSAMMRHLLAERFNVQAHTEQRDFSGFHLVVAKGGPKFDAVPDDADYPHLDQPGFSTVNTISHGVGVAKMTAKAQTMPRFALMLANLLRTPVEDQTGLNGAYDFRLEFASNGSSPDQDGPAPIDVAIKRLGLSLEHAKVTRNVLILDHADKAPTAN